MGKLSTRDISMTAVLACVFVFIQVLMMWDVWASDFSAYYYAGYFYDLGQFDQVYAGPRNGIGMDMPPAWAEAVTAAGHGDEQTFPFLYLPWVAAAMAPISASFAPQQVMNFVLIMNSFLMIFSSYLAWKIMVPKSVPVWLWSLLSFGLLVNCSTATFAIMLGQAQILVFAFILLALERYKAGWSVSAGVLLGIAACIKLTPIAFAIIFLWDRNFRALASCAVICVICAVCSIAFVGMPLHAQLFSNLQEISQVVVVGSVTLSVESFLVQAQSILSGTTQALVAKNYFFPKADWVENVARLLLVSGLVAIWLKTRHLSAGNRLAQQTIGLSILLPLAAPLGWVHYFLMTTYLLPGLLHYLPRKTAWILIAAFFVILSSSVQLYTMLFVQQLEFFPQILTSFPLLLIMFATIALFANRGSSYRSSNHRGKTLQMTASN